MSPLAKYTLAGVAGNTAGEMLGAYLVSRIPSAPEWLVSGAAQFVCVYAALRFVGAK